jgi:hypothetical protein
MGDLGGGGSAYARFSAPRVGRAASLASAERAENEDMNRQLWKVG